MHYKPTWRVKLSKEASLGFSNVSKDTLGLYPRTGAELPVTVRENVGSGERADCGDDGANWMWGGL